VGKGTASGGVRQRHGDTKASGVCALTKERPCVCRSGHPLPAPPPLVRKKNSRVPPWSTHTHAHGTRTHSERIPSPPHPLRPPRRPDHLPPSRAVAPRGQPVGAPTRVCRPKHVRPLPRHELRTAPSPATPRPHRQRGQHNHHGVAEVDDGARPPPAVAAAAAAAATAASARRGIVGRRLGRRTF